MAVDFVFQGLPISGPPLGLVFGEEQAPGEIVNPVALRAQLPGLRAAIAWRTVRAATLRATLPPMRAAIAGKYLSNTSRPTVARLAHPMQGGADHVAGAQLRHQQAGVMRDLAGATRWQLGQPAGAPLRVVLPHQLQRQPLERSAHFAEAMTAAAAQLKSAHQAGDRRSLARATGFEEAVDTPRSVATRYQDAIRRRTASRGRYQEANAHRMGHQAGRLQAARPLALYRQADYEQAWPPRAGVYVPPLPPGAAPCYVPGLPADLVFFEPFAAGAPELIFRCGLWAPPPGAMVAVPVRRVYIVLNNVSARRVEGNLPLTLLTASMELSRDSWTWQFQATLPRSEFALLQPGLEGDPVEIEVTVNGAAYRMQVEDLDRSRSFNKGTLSITCRGRAAILDAPYAPVMQFGNAQAATAAQLMADVLTVNGQPFGWSVDFNLTDWLVPAGAFSLQGSYIAALNAIAQAAGGYIQPHPTLEQLHVLPAYPSVPWEWGAVAPDYELPAAVTVLEGMRNLLKPAYNRVFIAGAGGIGQVTRAGSAGDLVAPMVTDNLASHVDARRQRGRAILGDTGRQIEIRLKLPVLEATGIIQPGKFIRYVDGATSYTGIARAVSVEIGRPALWQSITVETHL